MRRDVQDGTKSEQSQATAAQDASGFGKNADFSTPTEIYLKAASKDI